MLVGIVVIANGSDDEFKDLACTFQHFQLMLRIVALYAFPRILHSLNPFKAQETAVGQTDQLPAEGNMRTAASSKTSKSVFEKT